MTYWMNRLSSFIIDKLTKLVYKLFQDCCILFFITMGIPYWTVGIDVADHQNSVLYYRLPVFIFQDLFLAGYTTILSTSAPYTIVVQIDNSCFPTRLFKSNVKFANL